MNSGFCASINCGHKCINDELYEAMKEESYRLVNNWGGNIVEINYNRDHIHLLVNLPLQMAPSKTVCTF